MQSRPLSWTLDPEPLIPNPRPSTLNPRPSTLDPRPSTLDPQPSVLNPRPRHSSLFTLHSSLLPAARGPLEGHSCYFSRSNGRTPRGGLRARRSAGFRADADRPEHLAGGHLLRLLPDAGRLLLHPGQLSPGQAAAYPADAAGGPGGQRVEPHFVAIAGGHQQAVRG